MLTLLLAAVTVIVAVAAAEAVRATCRRKLNAPVIPALGVPAVPAVPAEETADSSL